jgi:uncharacterized protein
MLKVEVVNSFLVNMGKEFVILLRGKGDARTLPISIGQLEAQSIALQLNKITFPRPLTHDLFRTVLDNCNAKVVRTEICALREETFFAHLVVEFAGREFFVDARPSDAIAMALRFSAPVFVDETVMEEAGVIIPGHEGTEVSPTGAGEEPPPVHEHASVELLRQKLKSAISEERYEEAARIRDELKRHTASN